MEKLKVFISSAMDELECERDVAIDTITNLGMVPMYFETHAGVNDPLTESLRLVQKSNITLVILWKRYSRVVEEEYKCALSLNEEILVIEKELKDEEQREDQLSTFLNQIKDSHTYKKFRTPSQLREKIINGIQQVLFDRFVNTIVKLPDDDLYIQIRTILNKSENVCMLSRTPILLFGPRIYLSENKLPDEKRGYKITSSLLNAAIEGKRKFTLIVSSHSVIKEIENHPNSKELARFVLKKSESLCKKQTETFRIVCTPVYSYPPQYLTFIVADNTVVIWIKSPSTNHCIVSKNANLAFAFRNMADEYIRMDGEEDYKSLLKAKLGEIIRNDR